MENKPTVVEPAKGFSKFYDDVYTVVNKELPLRRGPRASRQVLKTLHHGDKVKCYGFYTKTDATVWLYVRTEDGAFGYCSYRCLKHMSDSR